MIRTLGEVAPGLEGSVEEIEVLTPKDFEDRFGLLGGNIMQGELTPDQMFSFRPIYGYGDYRTLVAGPYLYGEGTHPGGRSDGRARPRRGVCDLEGSQTRNPTLRRRATKAISG